MGKYLDKRADKADTSKPKETSQPRSEINGLATRNAINTVSRKQTTAIPSAQTHLDFRHSVMRDSFKFRQ